MNSKKLSFLKTNWPILFVSLLTILQQGRVIWSHGFKFTGSDQTVLWQITRDLSNGHFYEPYFYGQNYNFPLESWLVVPFFKIGFPEWIIFPLVTSFLFLFPFFILGYTLWKKDNHFGALISIGMPLLMQIEFNIISGLSRGFVTGLFVAGFLSLLLDKKTKFSFFLFGFVGISALAINPNSVVFVAPAGLYFMFQNLKKPSFYILGAIGGSIPLILKYTADQFYVIHPEYMLHSLWGNSFSFVALKDGILEMSQIFQYSMPVLWNFDWLVMLVIPASSVVLLKQGKKSEAIAALFGFITIFISMGFPKVHDSVGTIFLNTTRMWLALPLALALYSGWLCSKRYFAKRQIVLLSLAFVSFFAFKQSNFRSVLDKETAERNYGPISIIPIEDLHIQCNLIQETAKENQVTLVALMPLWDYSIPQMELLAYGCPTILDSPLPFVMGEWERRRFGHGEFYKGSHKRVLIVGYDPEKINHVNYGSTEKILDSPRMYLLELESTDTQTIFDLLNGTPKLKN